MASLVFYRKWRPQTLAEVVGQAPVTQTLLNALKSQRVAHAYLFCGPRGTGKTSTGRILAKAVNCLTTGGKGEPCNTCPMCQQITEGRSLDVIEIDAASNRRIDEVRDLRERVKYAPAQARFKVYIIDEVHMLTTEASNALLKTLEEPPPHAIFVLATTEAHKVLPTIMSRCQHFTFRRLAQADIVARLEHIAKAEGVKIGAESLRLIARSSSGSLRDAENTLEQLVTYYGTEVSLEQTRMTLGITGDKRVRELVKQIVAGDIAGGIRTIDSASADGLDLRQFHRELVDWLRSLLLVKTGSGESLDLTPEDLADLKALAGEASLEQILKMVKLFGQIEFGFDGYSTLPLELALVDAVLKEGTAEPSTTRKEATVTRPASVAAEKPPVKVTPTVSPEPARAAESVAPPPAAKAAEPVAEPTPPLVETLASETKTKGKRAKKAAPPPAAAEAPEKPPEAVAPPVTEATPKPEAPEVPQPAAAPAPPQAGGELEHLTQNWRLVLEQAPEDTRRTPAMAILRSAGVRPVAFEGDRLVLAFRYPLHKENMEKPQNQVVVEKIVSHFLGRPCQVRCVHKAEENHLVEAALKMGAQITSVEEK